MGRADEIEKAARTARAVLATHGPHPSWMDAAVADIDAALALPPDPVPAPSERERALVEAVVRRIHVSGLDDEEAVARAFEDIDRTHPRPEVPATLLAAADRERAVSAISPERFAEIQECVREGKLMPSHCAGDLLTEIMWLRTALAERPAPGTPEAMAPVWALVRVVERECGNEAGRIHSSIERAVEATIRTALAAADARCRDVALAVAEDACLTACQIVDRAPPGGTLDRYALRALARDVRSKTDLAAIVSRHVPETAEARALREARDAVVEAARWMYDVLSAGPAGEDGVPPSLLRDAMVRLRAAEAAAKGGA